MPRKRKKASLDVNEFRPLKLSKKRRVSHNSNLYRFDLSSPDEELNLPVSSFMLVEADLGEEKPVVRPYTPVTYDEKGHFDLLIKSYPTGKISKFMGELKVGDSLSFKGPNKKIPITPNMKKNIGMVAGGTGITPMLQVIREILKNPEDKTQLTLLYSNTTEDDILLRTSLDLLAQKHKNFKVHYTLTRPPPGWKQSVGRVTENMIKSQLPPPGNDTLVLVCGPPGFVETVSGPKTEKYEQGTLQGHLKKLGFTESQVPTM